MSKPRAAAAARYSNDDSNDDFAALVRKTSFEMEALNLDHLTQQKQEYRQASSRGGGSYGRRHRQFFNPLACISAYISMLCYYHPILCGIVGTVAILSSVLAVVNVLFNPTQQYGIIYSDSSNIQSKFDLTMGKIDHWCLSGSNSGCRCEDPLVPVSGGDRPSWVKALQANHKAVQSYSFGPKSPAHVVGGLDVAFLGESVVETMNGRWLGTYPPSLQPLLSTFKSNFVKDSGANLTSGTNLNGIALGIAGDTAGNVLWRLINSEMPESFNPKVWWLSLGNNDLGRMKCSEEVVILGILRVVEEILENKPNAQIVINSVFPMASMRSGLNPLMSDYKDSLPSDSRGRFGGGSDSTLRERNRHKDDGGSSGGRHDRSLSLREKESKDGDAIPSIGQSSNQKTALEEQPVVSSPVAQKPVDNDTGLEEQEEALEKASRKKWRWFNWHKKDPVNPKLVEKNSIRKYNVKTALVKKNKIPIFTAIQAINKELQKFAENHDQVDFFDSTDLFTEREGSDVTLLTDLISVRGLPTPAGHIKWQAGAAEQLQIVLAGMKRNRPELFEETQVTGGDEVETENMSDKKVKAGSGSFINDDASIGDDSLDEDPPDDDDSLGEDDLTDDGRDDANDEEGDDNE